MQNIGKTNRKRAALLIGSALLAMTGKSIADNVGIQEIIVTAQKNEETLQNTPITMAAMSGEALEQRGVVDYAGIAATTPSISFTPFPSSSDTLMIFMRGQGNGDPAQITTSGAVGLYEDGIYIARAQGSTFDLADVERVEVLRGPQGTLYGRNTTGGAVNIITKQPTGEFGFKQKFSFGTRNLFRSVTTVDLPRWGDVSTKVTLLKSSVDGYIKNSGSSHDFGEQAQQAGRFALHWDASDVFAVDYAFEKGDIDSTPLYYQNKSVAGMIPGYRTSASRTYRDFDLPLSTVRYEGHALTMSWDVSDALTIKSLTGYRKLNADYLQDYAESFVAYGFPLNFRSHDVINSHQFSQELQFLGSVLDNRIQYAAGLYYFREGGSHYEYQDYGFPVSPGFYVEADTMSAAAYAQVTWTPDILDDRLDLTVGGRYTRDEPNAERYDLANDIAYQYTKNELTFKRFNPMFTANFRVTTDMNVYAKYATGFRAGGSNERGADFSQTFSPEKVETYELGLKSYWWDRRVQANLAYFYTDYRDMQINVTPEDNVAQSEVINAGRANLQGVEADLLFSPIEDLTLNASYAYLYSKIKNVEVDDKDYTDYYAMPYAPTRSYSLGADYTFLHFDKGDLSAHMDYHWQSGAYMSGVAGPAVPNRSLWQRPAYGLLDARVTLALDLPRGDHAKVALWGKNLTDRKYAAHVTPNGNPYDGYTSQAYALGEPRSVGIDLVYEY